VCLESKTQTGLLHLAAASAINYPLADGTIEPDVSAGKE
jgi:hypothetical protein